jgi:hypothetical protein
MVAGACLKATIYLCKLGDGFLEGFKSNSIKKTKKWRKQEEDRDRL